MAEARPGSTPPADRSVAAERAAAISRMRAEVARIREADDAGDAFQIDLDMIPDGMSYNWKRLDNGYGKPDEAHMARLKRMGWTEVPARRHPELFGDRAKDEPAIHKGMILMERPIELTQDAHIHNLKLARKNIADQTAKLKISGHDLMPRVLQKNNRKFKAMDVDIPDDNA